MRKILMLPVLALVVVSLLSSCDRQELLCQLKYHHKCPITGGPLPPSEVKK